MDDSAIAVFTNRGRERLLSEGGSQSWALDPTRAVKCTYVVCIQNRTSQEWGAPTHDHRHAFLVGKIAGVSPSRETPGRFLIHFEQFADIDKPIEEKWRNPVRYTSLGELGIDPATLTFKRVRARHRERLTDPAEPPASAPKRGLDIANAKKALAEFYGVPVGAIEIVIRG